MGLFSKNQGDNAQGGKKPMTPQALTDVTRGMHHAALATSNLLANQYLYLLGQFFDEDEDGQMRAKMVYVQLDETHGMNVPLISLVAPKGIVMDKMKVAMSVRMEEADVKDATHELDNSDATRASFKVQLSPRSDSNTQGRASDIIDLEMEFSAIDPPEGIMKVIDEYVNLISPFEINNGKEDAR